MDWKFYANKSIIYNPSYFLETFVQSTDIFVIMRNKYNNNNNHKQFTYVHCCLLLTNRILYMCIYLTNASIIESL